LEKDCPSDGESRLRDGGALLKATVRALEITLFSVDVYGCLNGIFSRLKRFLELKLSVILSFSAAGKIVVEIQIY